MFAVCSVCIFPPGNSQLEIKQGYQQFLEDSNK